MKFTITGLVAITLLLAVSCNNPERSDQALENLDTLRNDEFDKDQNIDNQNDLTSISQSGRTVKDGITVSVYNASPKFNDAKLKIKTPKKDDKLKPGVVSFTYELTGYELGKPTSDAGQNGLANSDKGQHIHAILNNEPYMAEYTTGFEKDLKEGHYVLLSFLSRSYHESLKQQTAGDIIQFTVGANNTDKVDLNAPQLFYSRPKGEYVGADTKKLLLDFYLINCELAADGYKVKATLNGTEFILDKWVAYVVEGLPIGELRVKLELLDKDGNQVESPFNPVERTVTLKA